MTTFGLDPKRSTVLEECFFIGRGFEFFSLLVSLYDYQLTDQIKNLPRLIAQEKEQETDRRSSHLCSSVKFYLDEEPFYLLLMKIKLVHDQGQLQSEMH